MEVEKKISALCKVEGVEKQCKIKGINNKLFNFFHWNINKSNSELDFATINAYIVSINADVVSLNETNRTKDNTSLDHIFPRFSHI